MVLGRSLSAILDEVNVSEIDFLSLDVEGFEINVLNGIDFTRHSIRVILVECLNSNAFQQISEFLSSKGYRLEKQITHRDYLFIANTL